MAQLTRNHTLPTPTSNKATTPAVFRTSHSNVFSFPTITLARTGSGKSFSVDMTGIVSLPTGSRSKSKDSYSRSGGSKDSDIPLGPIIAAIKRGNFLQLSDTNLDILIRAMAGKNSKALETICLTALAISSTDGKLLARLVKSSEAANIKVLKLNRNAISQQASKFIFEALKTNKSITTLTVVRSGVNDKVVKYIAKALANNDTLKELDLSSNRITAQGMEDLCEALAYNRSLTRLCLESNNIRGPGAPALARLLAKNRVIRHLNVGSNGLGCDGCILIAESVRFNRTLTSLSLDLNEMGPRGAAAMAVALVSNRHLTHLYMPHNNIGDQGLIEICESLKRNRTLIALDMELNHIGHGQSIAGMQALGEVLKVNTTLRELNLSYNIFSSAAIQELMEGVSVNSTLESILFTNCCISTEGALAIAKVLPLTTGLQNLGLTANPDIAVEGYWALATSLAKNRSMKGIQLDYNSEDRHVLYESIQHSLTRNFIWQQAIYSASCRILMLSRIVLLGRPAQQKLLQLQQIQEEQRLQQQQQQQQSGGTWNLLRKVGLGRSGSSNSLASMLSLGKNRSVNDNSAPSNGSDGVGAAEGIVSGVFGSRNLPHGNSLSRQGSASNGPQMPWQGSNSSVKSMSALPPPPPQPYRSSLPMQQRRQQQQPYQQQQPVMDLGMSVVGSKDYNAHEVMANLGNMPYEIFETICAFLDPGRTMSIGQIRATVRTAGDRSTLVAYYTKERMLERIFCRRFIPAVGMRYSVKNGEERI
ncbi:hypothetical protein BGZ72_004567 [Mortierella alpina]|nr:hypothetical protein BGZ72_004567 [Mortierella alpina]